MQVIINKTSGSPGSGNIHCIYTYTIITSLTELESYLDFRFSPMLVLVQVHTL